MKSEGNGGPRQRDHECRAPGQGTDWPAGGGRGEVGLGQGQGKEVGPQGGFQPRNNVIQLGGCPKSPKLLCWEFPSDPGVGTWHFYLHSPGSVLGGGT